MLYNAWIIIQTSAIKRPYIIWKKAVFKNNFANALSRKNRADLEERRSFEEPKKNIADF